MTSSQNLYFSMSDLQCIDIPMFPLLIHNSNIYMKAELQKVVEESSATEGKVSGNRKSDEKKDDKQKHHTVLLQVNIL